MPPIVLFVENDADTLDMYSTYFEMCGMWVAKCTSAAEAISSLADLRPDVVVSGLEFDTAAGADFVHTLKASAAGISVPLVVLSGSPPDRIPAGVQDEADLCLVKPILPDHLLATIQRLLRASHELRARSERVRGRTAELMERSQALFSRAEAIDGTLETAARRRCPHCGNPLTWIERGALGDRDFDYYTWCTHGCGLYCFDRGSNKWVKLA